MITRYEPMIAQGDTMRLAISRECNQPVTFCTISIGITNSSLAIRLLHKPTDEKGRYRSARSDCPLRRRLAAISATDPLQSLVLRPTAQLTKYWPRVSSDSTVLVAPMCMSIFVERTTDTEGNNIAFRAMKASAKRSEVCFLFYFRWDRKLAIARGFLTKRGALSAYFQVYIYTFVTKKTQRFSLNSLPC